MSDLVMTELRVPCKRRTYLFPNSERIDFKDVTHVCVRPSGTHRLNMADGTKAIVSSGWLAIELETEEWTF